MSKKTFAFDMTGGALLKSVGGLVAGALDWRSTDWCPEARSVLAIFEAAGAWAPGAGGGAFDFNLSSFDGSLEVPDFSFFEAAALALPASGFGFAGLDLEHPIERNSEATSERANKHDENENEKKNEGKSWKAKTLVIYANFLILNLLTLFYFLWQENNIMINRVFKFYKFT